MQGTHGMQGAQHQSRPRTAAPPRPAAAACRPYLSKVVRDLAPQHISLLWLSEVVRDVQEPFVLARIAKG